MCSMMFCKQMNLTYVTLALLHDRLINNIKMESSLSFEQQKAILKWYWSTENVVEVQWQCVCVFQCQPTVLLSASGSLQGGQMALSVIYFQFTHWLGRPHYVWDVYLYSVL